MSDLSAKQKSLLAEHRALLLREATLTNQLAGIKMKLRAITSELSSLNGQYYMTRPLARSLMIQQTCVKCGIVASDTGVKVTLTRNGPTCSACSQPTAESELTI